MPSWLIWVIVAIVVIAVIAAVVVASNKKKQERNRTRAGELREQAAAQASGLQQREAQAKETDAKAAMARAEADRKQAEAERLEAEAHERHQTAAGYREQHVDNLRQADELDPDVDTRSDEYAGPEPTVHESTTHDSTAHQSTGPRTAGDIAGRESRDDATTVTHPDGTTETVSDPAAPAQADGGSHRA
jgi:uncharacterized membrane protein YdfJ with MMPL/SSD domain